MSWLIYDAAWYTFADNKINLAVLLAIIFLSIYKRNIIIYVFMAYYAGYIFSDFAMCYIELSLPNAEMYDYQRTWHLMLAILAAAMMFYIMLNALFYGVKILTVLTAVYIMLFYVVPNVGFAGALTPEYDDIYNAYGSFGVLIDIALIALSLIKERGNGCNRMAYNG